MKKILRIHFTKTSGTESRKDIEVEDSFDYINRVELLTPKTEDKILQTLHNTELEE